MNNKKRNYAQRVTIVMLCALFDTVGEDLYGPPAATHNMIQIIYPARRRRFLCLSVFIGPNPSAVRKGFGPYGWFPIIRDNSVFHLSSVIAGRISPGSARHIVFRVSGIYRACAARISSTRSVHLEASSRRSAPELRAIMRRRRVFISCRRQRLH